MTLEGSRSVRIVVAGSSGAGKTTLAKQLASVHQLPFHEIDAIYHGPGWIPNPHYLEVLQSILESSSWVVDSVGYQDSRELTFQAATHLVWLDLRRTRSTGRVALRSIRRVINRTELWNGNRETPLGILSPTGPIAWSWRMHAERRRWIGIQIRRPEYSQLAIRHFRTPQDVEAWIRGGADLG